MNVCFDCITESVTYCDPTTPKAPFKSSLQTLFTKDLLCDRAGLQIDPNVTLPTPQNGTLCKGIKTLQQFIDKRNACADKIVKMWQANKADKETCRLVMCICLYICLFDPPNVIKSFYSLQ